MSSILRFASFLFAFSLLGTSSLYAQGFFPYDEKAFSAASAAGHGVVLDFHAEWCPTCRKQERVLTEILAAAPYSSLTIFKVDYDSAKELKSEYKIRRQSTLVLLKSGKELNRSIALTSKQDLADFLKPAL